MLIFVTLLLNLGTAITKLPASNRFMARPKFRAITTKIANGGAALTAYSRMQFVEMTEAERQQLRSALLKYCELDTLAMVMVYEAWKDWVA